MLTSQPPHQQALTHAEYYARELPQRLRHIADDGELRGYLSDALAGWLRDAATEIERLRAERQAPTPTPVIAASDPAQGAPTGRVRGMEPPSHFPATVRLGFREGA